MNTCCDINDRIIDADCEYENGKFKFRKLPHCLPELFTVRFKAPADFTAGDVVVVRKHEYPVYTSQMEAAGSDIFKAGAVMMCEIDCDRDLAFIRTGGAAGSSGSGEEVEFQSSDLVYYIDPLGDDSPNNSGTMDSPFKTLGGAGRAAWQNIVMNPMGELVFSFNPGTYELTSQERLFMTEATHPLGLTFRGSDLQNKPLLAADHFMCVAGRRNFENMRLLGRTADYAVVARFCALLFLRDVEVIAGKSNCHLVFSYSEAAIRILGNLKLNGNGLPINNALGVNAAHIRADNSSITLEAMPQVANAFARCEAGNITLKDVTFTGSTAGKRYNIYRNGVIATNTSNENYLPGTMAGTIATGGVYQ